MPIEKWDPWQELTTLQQNVNELFNNFFTRFSSTKEIAFTPQINMYETEKEIILNVALPGTLQEDIDISLEKDDVLYIRGERTNPHEAIVGLRHIEELCYGYFERRVHLPAKCSNEEIKADFSEGILNIRLIKKV
ncbi:MAG: Hsp20/alpha crystallin family protein [Candidatus Scalinduaceae bacterium]